MLQPVADTLRTLGALRESVSLRQVDAIATGLDKFVEDDLDGVRAAKEAFQRRKRDCDLARQVVTNSEGIPIDCTPPAPGSLITLNTLPRYMQLYRQPCTGSGRCKSHPRPATEETAWQAFLSLPMWVTDPPLTPLRPPNPDGFIPNEGSTSE
eukprot:1182638-Prorocentrum_minimum.AAC.1